MAEKYVHVKICGMTRPQDVRAAVEQGVNAIGMILHADSPRAIDLAQAKLIRAEVPALVSLIGVFVDCPADEINRCVDDIGLDLVQLHGAEVNDFGRMINAPFIKAIRARSRSQVEMDVADYPDARAILIDPYVKGLHGGTGQQLDVECWPKTSQKLILAGGLSPDNLAQSVARLAPFAVDLNSGVESAPGIKDSTLIEQALRVLRRCPQ